MKAWQGSLGLAPVDGIVSPAYFVFEADFAVPGVRRVPAAKQAVRREVRRGFGWGQGRAMGPQYPANAKYRCCSSGLAEEQAAIVKYLAHANARIDIAVAAKAVSSRYFGSSGQLLQRQR